MTPIDPLVRATAYLDVVTRQYQRAMLEFDDRVDELEEAKLAALEAHLLVTKYEELLQQASSLLILERRRRDALRPAIHIASQETP